MKTLFSIIALSVCASVEAQLAVSKMPQVTTIQPGDTLLVSTGAVAKSTRNVALTNLLASMINLPGWPASSSVTPGSVTNVNGNLTFNGLVPSSASTAYLLGIPSGTNPTLQTVTVIPSAVISGSGLLKTNSALDGANITAGTLGTNAAIAAQWSALASAAAQSATNAMAQNGFNFNGMSIGNWSKGSASINGADANVYFNGGDQNTYFRQGEHSVDATVNGVFLHQFSGNMELLPDFQMGVVTAPMFDGPNRKVWNDAIGQRFPVPPLWVSTWFDTTNNAAALTEAYVTNQIYYMKVNGWSQYGYEGVWIDDGWMAMSRVNGRMTWDPTRFPHGIPWLVNYAKTNGFKLGLYLSTGTNTCMNFPGTLNQYVEQDVNDLASWGVSALKIDACGTQPMSDYSYQRGLRFGNAILNASLANGYNNTNTQPILMLCTAERTIPGDGDWTKRTVDWRLRELCNIWEDAENGPWQKNGWPWTNVLGARDVLYTLSLNDFQSVRPGHYAELTGFWSAAIPTNVLQGMVSGCAMAASPICASQITSNGVAKYFTNAEVLAIVRDPAVIPATRYYSNNLVEVWMRPLGGNAKLANDFAVGVVNWGNSVANLSGLGLDNCGLSLSNLFSVRDVWARTNMGYALSNVSLTIPTNSFQLYRFSKVPQDKFEAFRTVSLDVTTTTWTDDPVLSFPITDTSGYYEVDALVVLMSQNGDTTPGFHVQLLNPANENDKGGGYAGYWPGNFYSASPSWGQWAIPTAWLYTINGQSSGVVEYHYRIKPSAAGTIKIQFAQANTSASFVRLCGGSYLKVRRIP